LGVARHLIVDIDLRAIGGSALTDEIDVPKSRSSAEMSVGIPVTYVPARNTLLLFEEAQMYSSIGNKDKAVETIQIGSSVHEAPGSTRHLIRNRHPTWGGGLCAGVFSSALSVVKLLPTSQVFDRVGRALSVH